jgi:hypothetical protein
VKVAVVPDGRKMLFEAAQSIVAVLVPTVTVSTPGVARLYVTVPLAVVGAPLKACARAVCGARAPAAIAAAAQDNIKLWRLLELLRADATRTGKVINNSMATSAW